MKISNTNKYYNRLLEGKKETFNHLEYDTTYDILTLDKKSNPNIDYDYVDTIELNDDIIITIYQENILNMEIQDASNNLHVYHDVLKDIAEITVKFNHEDIDILYTKFKPNACPPKLSDYT